MKSCLLSLALGTLLIAGCEVERTDEPDGAIETDPAVREEITGEDAREAGRDVGEGAREFGEKAKEVGKDIAEGATEFGQGVKDGFDRDADPE